MIFNRVARICQFFNQSMEIPWEFFGCFWNHMLKSTQGFDGWDEFAAEPNEQENKQFCAHQKFRMGKRKVERKRNKKKFVCGDEKNVWAIESSILFD